MTIDIQRKGNNVFLNMNQDNKVQVTLVLSMIEARNLRDFLTDMQLFEGDPTVLDAIVRDCSAETGVAPLPKNFELIALEEAQRRNAKADKELVEFYKGEKK
jgi:hypothetical protein